MFFLGLSILSSVIIANLLKMYSRDENAPILLIFLGNYLFAAVVSHFLNPDPLAATRPLDMILGAVMGFFLLFSFVVYEKNIQKNGLSLSVGVMRGSLLIPILLAVFFFGERVGVLNCAGIGLTLLAFFRMSGNQPPENLVWILLLFVVAGLTDSFFKLYNVYGRNSEALFLFYSFSAAALFNLGLIARRGGRFHWRYLLHGIALGIPNQLTAFFFMKSLRAVPAAIAYPLFSSGIVIFSIATDLLIWRARFSRDRAGLLLLLLIGVVLLNVGR